MTPVGFRFQLFLGLATLGLWFAIQPVLTLVLPMQVAMLTPAGTATYLAIVTAAGAAIGLLANLFIGALSDRTTSPFGRRRPWIGAGAVVAAAGLWLMAEARGIGSLVVAMMTTQVGANAMLCATTAIIPDMVPERQRGIVSGIVGLGVPMSILLGSILVGSLVGGVRQSYAAIALVMVALVAPFLLSEREPLLSKGQLPRRSGAEFWKGFWVSPRHNRDFALAWVTRFLVVLGYALGLESFLFLYVQHVLRYQLLFPGHAVKEGVAILLVIATSCLIPMAVIAGVVSDRLQRRKVFVTTSSLLIAAGLGLLGFIDTWTMAEVAAVLLGLGFGAYVAVDSALITQVLPSPTSRGKDLGIINIANALPDIIAPPLAAFLINLYGQDSSTGYRTLLWLAASLVLVSAILVRGIKSVP